MYLIKRAQLLLQEIETSYQEIRLINNLLSDIHDEVTPLPTVPALNPQRPPLHKNLSSYRSESEMRHRERDARKPPGALDPLPLHPAHRVESQSNEDYPSLNI